MHVCMYIEIHAINADALSVYVCVYAVKCNFICVGAFSSFVVTAPIELFVHAIDLPAY